MAMLNQITIRGYRSIKDAKIELTPINVLIGANGSGKSNFISFFKLLNEMMAGRLQLYIAVSGGAQTILHFGLKTTKQLDAKLLFKEFNRENTYSIELYHAEDGKMIFGEEFIGSYQSGVTEDRQISLGSGHAETNVDLRGQPYAILYEQPRFEVIFQQLRYMLDETRVYHFHDTSHTARMRQPSYIHDNYLLMPDAGNIASMLYVYQQENLVVYNRIVSTIRKLMPEFETFQIEPLRLNTNDVVLNWRKQGQDYLFGPHQISDGTLRAMAIITLFLQPEVDLPQVIIMDEPELGLHPVALELVAGLIRSVAHRTQVIIATQSQNFLNYFDPSEIITVESHNNASVFRRLNAEDLKDWLEDYSIGELWQRNVIGAGPIP